MVEPDRTPQVWDSLPVPVVRHLPGVGPGVSTDGWGRTYLGVDERQCRPCQEITHAPKVERDRGHIPGVRRVPPQLTPRHLPCQSLRYKGVWVPGRTVGRVSPGTPSYLEAPSVLGKEGYSSGHDPGGSEKTGPL